MLPTLALAEKSADGGNTRTSCMCVSNRSVFNTWLSPGIVSTFLAADRGQDRESMAQQWISF
jgi:hypothetical protein